MMDEHEALRIGEEFGNRIADLMKGVRLTSVTIESITDTNAMVTVFEDDIPIAVPLKLFGVEDNMFSVTPAVGSTAVIGYVDGSQSTPFFVAFSQVDKVEVKRSNSSFLFHVDPDDDSKDTLDCNIGGSSIHVTSDVIQLNGGGNGGMVIVGKLTDRLNKMQSEIDQIQANIASHTHLVSTTGTATAQTGSTTQTTYSKVSMTKVKDDDYVNDKITQ